MSSNVRTSTFVFRLKSFFSPLVSIVAHFLPRHEIVESPPMLRVSRVHRSRRKSSNEGAGMKELPSRASMPNCSESFLAYPRRNSLAFSRVVIPASLKSTGRRHAGRKADSSYDDIIAPSAIPFADEKAPRELTKEEVISLQKDFINSVKLVKQAGFDFVEIHCAHGYLINQFLSPLSNQRNDEYGGSLEKRYKFLGDILKEIKNIDIDVHIRVSANEYDEKGNSRVGLVRLLPIG